jgi:hypothetical protein
MERNASEVVLGHELFHAWQHEFIPGMGKSSWLKKTERLEQEFSAVDFENYLRASFGERKMRKQYTLEGSTYQYNYGADNAESAKKYKLPFANYMKYERIEQPLPSNSDIKNPAKPPIIGPVDTRKQKTNQ